MNAVFADTSYYIALLNADDAAYQLALDVTAKLQGPIVTTDWILAELGNFLADPRNRGAFINLVRDLRQDSGIEIVSADRRLFEAGFEMYEHRNDKAWSMVDCISFCVMKERGMVAALSTDHHFEQAGFAVILKS